MNRAAPEHVSDVERGRAAYQRRDWRDAHEALTRADADARLGPDDLERLAWSAGLAARDEDTLRLWERIHVARLEDGDALGAARAAFWLGLRLSSLGEMGRASGWLGRAQRLLDGVPGECAVRGYLLLPVIWRHVTMGKHDQAHAAASEAAAIGERCGDRDLITFARQLQGRTLLCQGRIQEGLALLDEAMVAVTAGELSPLIVGLIYCNVIACCQEVYDLQRAREWTAALTAWCEAQPQLVTFTGTCLLHRAELMLLGGEWLEALEEARRAAGRFAHSLDRDIAARAAYQEAEVHRLRGELAEAEEGYRRASERGREPQPGLALLRLAQDRRDVAATAIRRVIGTTHERLQLAGLLPAYVEIMLAIGELDEARDACRKLEDTAARVGTDVLGAMAAHARGAILLAEGEAARAAESLRRAFQVWHQIGAPYIAARIRVLLACAYRALGDEDSTELELDAARQTFAQLGAVPDTARVDALAGKTKRPPPRHDALTPREVEVLRLIATGKTNKAIAGELRLSEKTVDRHVSNIFVKVNVGSRAAATAYAYEHGLVHG